ncbi:hypothetical protein Sjap_022375 [Stephania japonica]|uniref:Uncharacterized protein n=1 Tax=Stephania japonica TaxID=461633 RepID=A0AAP0EW23_9MAGN
MTEITENHRKTLADMTAAQERMRTELMLAIRGQRAPRDPLPQMQPHIRGADLDPILEASQEEGDAVQSVMGAEIDPVIPIPESRGQINHPQESNDPGLKSRGRFDPMEYEPGVVQQPLYSTGMGESCSPIPPHTSGRPSGWPARDQSSGGDGGTVTALAGDRCRPSFGAFLLPFPSRSIKKRYFIFWVVTLTAPAVVGSAVGINAHGVPCDMSPALTF